jgi:predicted nucleic-acid-binding protein
MRYGVDTSIVLRVLTGKPESLAAVVRTRLEELWLDGVILDVCDLVVSETYFALQHSYRLSKDSALNALVKLSEHPGFRLSSQVIAALQTPNLATAKPGFLDRVIHGTYVTDDESVMLTCEKDARKLAGVEVVRDKSA